MKAEYINSFYKAAKDVFQLMVDIEPQRGELKLVENLCNNKDANIELGVVGDLKGKILFSFPKRYDSGNGQKFCPVWKWTRLTTLHLQPWEKWRISSEEMH